MQPQKTRRPLDVCCANTFVANIQGKEVKGISMAVIGGHAGINVLSLFSRVEGVFFSDEELEALTVQIVQSLLSCTTRNEILSPHLTNK